MNVNDANNLSPIIDDYVSGYINDSPEDVGSWLEKKMQSVDSQRSPEEISKMCDTIIRTASTNTEMRESLNEALNNGKSINSWFAEKVMESCKGMTPGQIAKHITICRNAALTALNQNVESETGQSDVIVVSDQPEQYNDADWNSYRIKDLAYDTADQIHTLAISALGNDSGYTLSESIQPVIQSALNGEVVASTDIKAVVAAALQSAVNRGLISELPIGTSSEVINNIAFSALNNLDAFRLVADGKLSDVEGIYQVATSSVATVAGMAIETKGAALGAAIGIVFGPVGAAVGGAIGRLVGRFLGSKAVKTITNVAHKVGNMAKTAIKKIGSKIKEIGSKIKNFLFG